MKGDLQLTLASFDPNGPPLCREQPAQNASQALCVHCSRAQREGTLLQCTLYMAPVRAKQKYSLTGWKHLRTIILTRDGRACVLCGNTRVLHVHHLNTDKTEDSPDNLLSVCDCCHARIHSVLLTPGGADTVASVLSPILKKQGKSTIDLAFHPVPDCNPHEKEQRSREDSTNLP